METNKLKQNNKRNTNQKHKNQKIYKRDTTKHYTNITTTGEIIQWTSTNTQQTNTKQQKQHKQIIQI